MSQGRLELSLFLKKPGQKNEWGGFSGYSADLDGHLWEVAYNPFFWPGPKDEHLK